MIEILHLDRCFVVCVKPAGVLSTDEPGGLPDLLRRQLNTENIRTVHRLDAATGGVMVLARTKQAASLLSKQMQEFGFGKEYFAVVHGDTPESGVWEDLLGRDPVRRVTYVARAPGKDIRPAKLDYKVLAKNDGISLIKVQLHTGRTHQIRVQFASRGYPLVGDRKYGADDGCPLGLWSCRLAFRHPFEGTELEFSCAPPETAPWDRFERELHIENDPWDEGTFPGNS